MSCPTPKIVRCCIGAPRTSCFFFLQPWVRYMFPASYVSSLALDMRRMCESHSWQSHDKMPWQSDESQNCRMAPCNVPIVFSEIPGGPAFFCLTCLTDEFPWHPIWILVEAWKLRSVKERWFVYDLCLSYLKKMIKKPGSYRFPWLKMFLPQNQRGCLLVIVCCCWGTNNDIHVWPSTFSTCFEVANALDLCWSLRLAYSLYGCFRKIGGFSPQIIHWKIGISIINHPFWGFSPYFRKHPYTYLFGGKGQQGHFISWKTPKIFDGFMRFEPHFFRLQVYHCYRHDIKCL